MDWKSLVGFLAENWVVIWTSLPTFLVILGLAVWLTYLVTHKVTKALYAQGVKNAQGLQALAEKERDIVKTAREELEKKLAEKTPPPSKQTAPPDVIGVVTSQAAIKEAFTELNSPKGLHLPVDPRAERYGDVRIYLVDQRELERMAAARYFLDRGLVNFVKPDAMGTGVTVTASSTAAAAFAVVSKLPKPGGSSTQGSG